MSIWIREMAYHKIKLNKFYYFNYLVCLFIITLTTWFSVLGKKKALIFVCHLQIELDPDRDSFMNPWEPKEYGLIEKVIDDANCKSNSSTENPSLGSMEG